MIRVSISRRGPISLQNQLADQLRHQIEEGAIVPGEKLPTLRELALAHSINYNTVRSVYSQLQREGIVTGFQGRGTFVVGPQKKRSLAADAVRDLIDESLSRALGAGMTATEYARMAYARAALFQPRKGKARLLLTECNDADLRVMAREVREAMGVTPTTATVQELADKERSYFSQFSVVATTFPHLSETQKLLGQVRPVVGLIVEPSYDDVLADLAALPDGSTVGLVCFRQAAAEGMQKTIRGIGLGEKRFLSAGLDQPKKLSEVFAKADRVYASDAYLEAKGRKVLQEDPRVKAYSVHLAPSSLRYLRHHLDAAS